MARRGNASAGPRSERILAASFGAGSAQEQFGRGIGKSEALPRQAEAFGIAAGPAAPDEAGELRLPLQAQVEPRPLAERLERPAGVHPQAEGGRLACPAQGRKFFAPLDGPLAAFQLLAVE